MKANPLRSFPNNPRQTQLGPLLINDIYTIEDLPQDLQNEILGSVVVHSGTTVRELGARKFSSAGWISDKKTTANGHEIVFQFKFAREHLINWFSLSLLDVPQAWSISYYSAHLKVMVPFYANNRQIDGNINGFVNEINMDEAGWTTISEQSDRIRTNLIEIRMDRTSDGTIPYSLGLRNVSFAMRNDGLSPEDREEIIPTGFGPTENNTFYHHEGYHAIDDDVYNYWKSAPQAISASVQSLLVDIRGDTGCAQLFDTIGLLPHTLGARMALSYSNDDTISSFTTSDNNFAFESHTEPQSENANTWKQSYGYKAGPSGVYRFANKIARLDITQNWTIASEWVPEYTTRVSTGERNENQEIIIRADVGTWTIQYGENGDQSAPLAYNISTVNLETAIQGLIGIPGGTIVSVTGGPGDVNGLNPYVITFTTPASTNLEQLIPLGLNSEYRTLFEGGSPVTATGQQCLWSVDRTDGDGPAQLNQPVDPADFTNSTSLSYVFDVLSTDDATKTMTGNFKLLQSEQTLPAYVSPMVTLTNGIPYTSIITYTKSFVSVNGLTSTPTITWRFAEMESEQIEEDSAEVILDEFWVTDIHICNSYILDNTTIRYNKPLVGTMRRFWIRQDVINTAVATMFIANPDTFIWGEGNLESLTNGYFNALLVCRFIDTEVVKAGPGAGYFREKVWTPVPRDFVLNTKWYPLGMPCKAQFVKLEFNAGPGSYYDVNITETQNTLELTTFPQWVYDLYASYGVVDQTSLTQRGVFTPFERPVNLQIRPNDSIPALADALAGAGLDDNPSLILHDDMLTAEYWLNSENYTDTNSLNSAIEDSIAPVSNPIASKTTYSSQRVPATSDRAFFMSIGELKFFRSDLTIMPDASEYYDSFEDCFYTCQPGSFTQGDGYIQVTHTGTGGFDRYTAVCEDCFELCDHTRIITNDNTTWWNIDSDFEANE